METLKRWMLALRIWWLSRKSRNWKKKGCGAFAEAQDFLILAQPEWLDLARQWGQELESRQARVQLLQTRASSAEAGALHLSGFDWAAKPRDASLKKALAGRYDFLIHLGQGLEPLERYCLLRTQARCRMGMSTEAAEPLFDLLVAAQKNPNRAAAVEELKDLAQKLK